MVDIPGTEQLPGPAPERDPTTARLYGFNPGVVLADGMARRPQAPICQPR
jgi:hypothetical protein